MEVLETGGITSPKGFTAAGQWIGIKSEEKDLAFLVSETPAVAAGVFTQNVVKAAPVLWSQQIVKTAHRVRAIVINSGNANACTGSLGIKHTQLMAETAAAELGVRSNEVLVASTGVIGVPLPISTVCDGIRFTARRLASGDQADVDAAFAIRTTDTFSKSCAVRVQFSEGYATIAGMAKGSGMIHPNMATMLGFVTTDAKITPSLLQQALTRSVDQSYNMISVDGDTSTNDSVFALANGMAAMSLIRDENDDYQRFCEALNHVNTSLAMQIVRDGEGATKLLAVTVKGAATVHDARVLAKSVITSNLVKAAFFGEDANWGRILAAMGYSGVGFDVSQVHMSFRSSKGSIAVMRHGEPVEFDEGLAKEILKERDIDVFINAGEGEGAATAWGCDLSYDYVRINGSYRS